MSRKSGPESVMLVLTMLILIIPISLIKGFILTKVWLWFVSEPFGVIPLSIAHAAGLCEAMSIFRFSAISGGLSIREAFSMTTTNLIAAFIGLGICWIFHMFM